MINKEKVILMTKLSAYEQGEGKKYVPATNYFRGDYIGASMLWSFIAGTSVFCAILAIIGIYNFEVIMQDLYNIDLAGLIKKIGLIYGITMGIYLLFCYILSSIRFYKARKSLKKYYVNLRELYKYCK